MTCWEYVIKLYNILVSEFQCFLNNEIRDMPSVARRILIVVYVTIKNRGGVKIFGYN